ncbi:MAG: SDR family oxidoreductase [Nocardioidaceae bacterium]
MTSPILLTGGTGTLGSLVAPRLRDSGGTVRVLSRREHAPGEGIDYVTGDLATGAGVEAAVAGVGTIVHCAGSRTGDVEMTRHLVRAAAAAGAQHLVFISVVGAGTDRPMFGYFTAKRAAEKVVSDSGIPWTTLRATQFHDLILMVVKAMAKLPVLPVPAGFRFQPVDAAEVADRLAELAVGTPAGLVTDLAGPRAYELADLARSYLRASHRRRLLIPLPLPGGAARSIRAGANLPAEGADLGKRTWEDFLAERVC